MKLQAAVDLYLRSLKKPRSTKTMDNAKGVLQPLVLWLGQGRDVDHIGGVELIEFVSEVYTDGIKFKSHPKRPPEEGGLSLYTIDGRIKTIKAFFNFMVKMGYLEKSPAMVLTRPRLPSAVPPERAATTEEINALKKVLKHHVRNYAILMFLIHTGCRSQGIADLLLANVRVDDMSAIVTEKGAISRVVVFEQECKVALEEWLEQRQQLNIESDYYFVATRKPWGKLSSAAVGNIIERAAVAAKIPRPLHPHAIRHWWGNEAARNGISVATTANALGHRSQSVTLQHYYGTDLKQMRRAVRQVTQTTPEEGGKVIKFGS